MANLQDSTQNAVGELTNIASNLSLPIGKTFSDYIRATINYATQKAEDSIATLDPSRMSTGRMEEYRLRARNEFLAPFAQNLFGLGMQLMNFERAGEQWKAQHLLAQEQWNFSKNAAEEEAAKNRTRWGWEQQQYRDAQQEKLRSPLSGISGGKSGSAGSGDFAGSGSFGPAQLNQMFFPSEPGEKRELGTASKVGAGGRFPGSDAEKDYLNWGPPRHDFSKPVPRTTTPFKAPIGSGTRGTLVPPPKEGIWI